MTGPQPIAVRAAVVALVTAAVHTLAVLGVVDSDVEVAVGGLVDAVGLVVVVVWSRAAVTPNELVAAREDPRTGMVEAGPAESAPAEGRPVAVMPVERVAELYEAEIAQRVGEIHGEPPPAAGEPPL